MNSKLAEHLILIVERQATIAFDIAYAFQCVGARAVTSDSVGLALELVEADMWSAVILGPSLNEDDSSPLCERLKERDIPFLLYTGVILVEGACAEVPSIPATTAPAALVQMVEDLMQSGPLAH